MTQAEATTPGIILGERLGPFPGRIDSELVRVYATATKDPNPGPRAGSAVPPVAIVTQIWEAQQAAFTGLVPEPVRASMTGGVHGEHDVVLHRPIALGEELETWVEGWGSRRGGRHNLVTMRYETRDAHGDVIAEQWWTTVLLNAVGDPLGEAAPGHSFQQDTTDHPLGTYACRIDEDMPRRYAEVSQDWSGHHFTADAARASGFDRTFLHGLCTMGICAQGVVSLVADGNPDRVRRIAVRFASPAYVGDDVELVLLDCAESAYAFEAHSNGATVVRNGLVELRT